jgi:hypothetical protein
MGQMTKITLGIISLQIIITETYQMVIYQNANLLVTGNTSFLVELRMASCIEKMVLLLGKFRSVMV